MKKVCIQVGHWNVEQLTSENLRSWRSVDVLKRSTGASGERDYHWNEVMPRLRDKLIQAGVQVYIAPTIYDPQIYDKEYDLWISLHYDGGGTGERCMISAPNRDTLPKYLNETAQSESERFCQIWKDIYPGIVNVPNRDDMITAGMRDYFAFDYVGYDTPSVIVEHFNHTSARGTYLKEHPELVAEGDFKAIAKFLGIPEQPPVLDDTYKVVYRGEVLQEYESNPSDRIMDLSEELEREKAKVADLTKKNGTLQADYDDAVEALSTCQAELTKARKERDDAKAALSVAESALTSKTEELKICQQKLEELKSTNPLDAYGGWELVNEGFKKIFGRNKK